MSSSPSLRCEPQPSALPYRLLTAGNHPFPQVDNRLISWAPCVIVVIVVCLMSSGSGNRGVPQASLVYLRDREGRGVVGWFLTVLGSGGEWRRGKQLVSEREREREREKGGEGWRDGCKVRRLRKDK
ncbi:hypothetical protein INR49_004562 [Caranx melampygus]|nr:hypothetical protein INR49_004562 [Caranx melampygus]